MQNPLWSVLGMLAVTAAVLALSYWATRWIAARGLYQFSGGAGAASSSFCVLAQLAVGRNERLVLVKLQQSCYLLGVTENGITLLKELDESAAQAIQQAAPRPAGPAFLDVLRKNIEKRK